MAGLVRACHLQPTLAVVTVTTALAALAGRGPAGCTVVALAVLAGQLSTGWSNDWFDAGRDRDVGRIDKPIVAGDVSVGVVRAAACTALVATLPLSLLSGWRAAAVHVLAVASAWSYNLGLKATVVSPLPYAVSFGLLPAFVTLGLPHHPWPRPAVMAATALLGVGAHFVNTLADREDDARSGIAGLPQRMSARGALFTGVALLTSCAVMIWLLGGNDRPAASALLVVALGAAALVIASTLRSRPRAAWSWALVTVLGCLAMFAVSRPPLVAGRAPDGRPGRAVATAPATVRPGLSPLRIHGTGPYTGG
ncbi:MAG TPA: UbiA family prenyltransferase [Acidimicrobiales bacterium]|nr:UbiA family prenyltransferase [Acidimicrobiales bacterium]